MSIQQSSATPSLHLCFWGLREIVGYSHSYLAGPSCITSFWHCVIPTAFFVLNDFYTCNILTPKKNETVHVLDLVAGPNMYNIMCCYNVIISLSPHVCVSA